VEAALHDAQFVKTLAQWQGELGESTQRRLTARRGARKREEQTVLSRQEFTCLARLRKKTAGSETTPVSADHEKG